MLPSEVMDLNSPEQIFDFVRNIHEAVWKRVGGRYSITRLIEVKDDYVQRKCVEIELLIGASERCRIFRESPDFETEEIAHASRFCIDGAVWALHQALEWFIENTSTPSVWTRTLDSFNSKPPQRVRDARSLLQVTTDLCSELLRTKAALLSSPPTVNGSDCTSESLKSDITPRIAAVIDVLRNAGFNGEADQHAHCMLQVGHGA